MSIEAHSRRDFLAGAATAAALAVSGTATLSGLSAFATPLTQPSVDAGKSIPYGAAARSYALASDPSYRDAASNPRFRREMPYELIVRGSTARLSD